MAPVREITVQHFTHPSHALRNVTRNTEFSCDGCKLMGYGNRYRCDTCDFDLHEYCCTCPTFLASFLHPAHQLTRDVMKPQGQLDIQRVCNVCGMFVNGLFYKCGACDFDVHPLCAQLPQRTRHPLHAHHVLRLQPVPSSGPWSSGWCMVCKATSWKAWGYKCEVCDFGVHLKCFNSAPVGSVCAHSSSGSGSGSGSGFSSGSGLGLGSGSVLSFVNFANTLINAYQNISSGEGGGDVYSEIISWVTSTWSG